MRSALWVTNGFPVLSSKFVSKLVLYDGIQVALNLVSKQSGPRVTIVKMLLHLIRLR